MNRLRASRAVVAATFGIVLLVCAAAMAQTTGAPIPTGQNITPLAAPRAVFETLNPHLPALPNFLAGQASAVALSPDGRMLLIITSGYNRNVAADGKNIPDLSDEYVFVFDVSGERPVQRQVLRAPNTFLGLAWSHSGDRFYVSGGKDDDVLEFAAGANGFTLTRTIQLNHTSANGLRTKPEAAGIALSPDGRRLLVANVENDSVSLVDLTSGKVISERDLRPGRNETAAKGQAGGTYPRAVIWANNEKAYVGTARDREIVTLTVEDAQIGIAARLVTPGQPNAFVLGAGGRRLYVAEDNTDVLAVLDTTNDKLIEITRTAAPLSILRRGPTLGGAGTNALALSPDGGTLYATNGGENAIAVIRLGAKARGVPAQGQVIRRSTVMGLIPTGWYPTALALSHDSARLFVVNGKSNAGPNRDNCGPQLATSAEVNQAAQCGSANEYVWQLEKAGFLTLPTPDDATLVGLTRQVELNNHMVGAPEDARDTAVMAFLRHHIRHVIYVLKENRTYDQVLGDLEVGNGDPKLAILGEPLSPNYHQLARQFVDLDNIFASGEGSNTGWPWSISGRTNDFTEREAPINYADRGMDNDQFGYNRGIEMGLPPAKRIKPDGSLQDPDLLAGMHNVADADGPDGDVENGFIWSAALRAGVSVRNYGFISLPAQPPHMPPRVHDAFKQNLTVFVPGHPALADVSDPFYRGLDLAYPDFWRVNEWKREYDAAIAKGTAPALTLMALSNDHFGSFKDAIDGVNTVETQMADNDYALGRVVETVANGPFAKDTLIFVIEDDAQDGPDHVDSHRTVSLVVGPYVRQRAVISTRYTTVNFLRTIELSLGLSPIGLNDAFAQPMTDVFDIKSTSKWNYKAKIPAVLRTTQLPLPPMGSADATRAPLAACVTAHRSSAYWQAAMAGQDFSRLDHLDSGAFNRALWRGLQRDDETYPRSRSGIDMRFDRARLLSATRTCAVQ